jgi:hypothetical protein
VRSRPPVGGEEGDLTVLAPLVRFEELGERVRGRAPRGEQVEAARPVAPLGEGLRRDRADAGTRPGADRDSERA